MDAIVAVALLYSLWFCRAVLRRLVRLEFVINCVLEPGPDIATAVESEPCTGQSKIARNGRSQTFALGYVDPPF